MTLVQAAPRRQDRALAVRLDRAAFERPVDALVQRGAEEAAGGERPDEAVVAARAVLAAPAGEAEIEQAEIVAVGKRDRTRVAQPGVVVFDFDEADADGGDAGFFEATRGAVAHGRVGDADDQRLETGDRPRKAGIRGLDRLEARRPVGRFLGPGNDHPCLRLPLRRQAKSGRLHSF
jgi:hypothetical protein